jgi:abortive infection bacteriophage resistance protein
MKRKAPGRFTTLDEQICKLRHRNVIVPNEDRAKLYLLRDGYYSMINGYKDVFIDKGETNSGETIGIRTGLRSNIFCFCTHSIKR